MSRGDPGPYMSMDTTDVWVPRTVPYLEARRIAKSGESPGDDDRLTYVGKDDAELLGFSRDCRCDEVCELGQRDEYGDLTGDPATPCRVPAWHFRWVEP